MRLKCCLVMPMILLPNLAMGQGAAPSYRSPYHLEFHHPTKALVGDLLEGPRGDPKYESETPHSEWYAERFLKSERPWGPRPRLYPPPPLAEGKSAEWKRERIIATASRYIGYDYQHHHLPDWSPPARGGTPGHKGLDCSNFTAFAYNQALGIHINSDVKEQAEGKVAKGAQHIGAKVTRIDRHDEESHPSWSARLKASDLVFVRNREGHISHVVLWLGPLGRSPDGTPLILDSHGEDVKDSAGVFVPRGIQIRPYRPGSWYDRSTSHALRLVHD